MQHCDQHCGFCAREWFAWLKAREAQMSVPRKSRKFWDRATNRVVKVPLNETVSHSTAAETSVRPERNAK
jgi:hypothetical protein